LAFQAKFQQSEILALAQAWLRPRYQLPVMVEWAEAEVEAEVCGVSLLVQVLDWPSLYLTVQTDWYPAQV
jgi:hypothetical protein